MYAPKKKNGPCESIIPEFLSCIHPTNYIFRVINDGDSLLVKKR